MNSNKDFFSNVVCGGLEVVAVCELPASMVKSPTCQINDGPEYVNTPIKADERSPRCAVGRYTFIYDDDVYFLTSHLQWTLGCHF